MKRIYTVKIEEEYQFKTIKDFLRQVLSASTRVIKALKANNGIYLNQERAIVTQVLNKGDMLTLILEEEGASSDIIKTEGSLDIVYEDEDILILNKPPEIPVHPSPGHEKDSLANIVTGWYAAHGQNIVCRFVNRLDSGTSGLLCMGKHALAHSVLAKQLHTNQFLRSYLAIVQGRINQNGIIDAPILSPEKGIKRTVSLQGQPAKTMLEVLECGEEYSLVKLRLYTGRTHQIRVHMAYIGHPLYGDWLYGQEFSGGITRPALHSAYIELIQPLEKTTLKFHAPMPEDMLTLLSRLKGKNNF
mgnify:CR=1 FL=1